jgi:hypothetical protein
MITEKFDNELDALKADNAAQAEMISDMYVESRILHDKNSQLRYALIDVKMQLKWLMQISYSEDDGVGGGYWPGEDTRNGIDGALRKADFALDGKDVIE